MCVVTWNLLTEAAQAELAATFSSDKVEEISIPKVSRLHFSYRTLVVVLNKLNGSVAVQRDCAHFVGHQRHGQAFPGVRVAFFVVCRAQDKDKGLFVLFLSWS